MDSCFVNGLFLFFLHSLPDIVMTSTLPTIPCPLLLFFKSCKQFKFVYQRLSWYFNLQSGRFKWIWRKSKCLFIWSCVILLAQKTNGSSLPNVTFWQLSMTYSLNLAKKIGGSWFDCVETDVTCYCRWRLRPERTAGNRWWLMLNFPEHCNVQPLKYWVTLYSPYWNIVKGISNTAIACSSQLNLRLMFLNFVKTPACKSQPNFCLKITKNISFKMLTRDGKEFKLCVYIGAKFLGRALIFGVFTLI